MTTKRTKRVHTLEDLLVEEVSVVDRPANQRRFLTVKAEDGKGREIGMDDAGNLVTDAETQPAPSDDLPDLSEVFKSAAESLEKRLTIDPDMRMMVFTTLANAMGRLNAVAASADFAQTDSDGTKGPSTLVPVLAEELAAVAKEIGALSRSLGKKKTKKDAGEDEPDDALAALLDAVEEQVQKRGAKMSKARLTAFKSALDTLGKILNELDPVETTKAKDKVEKAPHVHTYKVNGQTVTTGPSSAAEGAAHTHKVTVNFKSVTTSSDAGGAGHSHTVTVDGKAIKGSGPSTPPEKSKGNPFADKAKKNADVDLTTLVDSVTSLTQLVEKQQATIKKQAKNLRSLRQARPGSNAIPVEKGAEDGPSRPDVSWPIDLNA